MHQSDQDFDSPWRKIYEFPMAITWVGGAVFTLVMMEGNLPIPPKFGVVAALYCLSMATYRGYQAWTRWKNKHRLYETAPWLIDIPTLVKIAAKARAKKSAWMGKGFKWTDIEASRMHALLDAGVAQTIGKDTINEEGAHWLQGLAEEEDLLMSLSLLEGHTLVTGTTGVGKTRYFDLMIAQAILRNEPVVIIDPKGDRALADNAKRVCEFMGQAERFQFFHPAFPGESISIDPLRNWNQPSELASRIAALIPSETGADPFTAFGWKVLSDVLYGLRATKSRPNLVDVRRYVEGGTGDLVLKSLRIHFQTHVDGWEARAATFIKAKKGSQLEGYIEFYRQVVIHEFHNVEIDGLISSYEHDRDHFQKMVASLIPVLSMLTNGPMAELLSPNFDVQSNQKATDMAQTIRGNKVLYIGLDSLANETVAKAIGSILLADLTAVAGDIYNYSDKKAPINVFVDEAAQIINQPTIDLLNKGRGAGFRMTIATQTFADFAARLGNESKARQVLANTNNKISFRILDSETQQYIADGIPKIKVQSMSIRYGHTVDPNIQDDYSASYMESAEKEEADLIPPGMLSELPTLHFFARLSGGKTIKGRIPILV
jgi:conjugal transfer pilus assembly protein TraD